MHGLRSAVVGFGAVATLLAASGCGSSSARGGSRTEVDGVSAQSVEHALVSVKPPRPRMVSCRTAAAKEGSAIFGTRPGPLFICELTFSGERASYVVQVLKDGCLVAERRRLGRALYGCGVKRS